MKIRLQSTKCPEVSFFFSLNRMATSPCQYSVSLSSSLKAVLYPRVELGGTRLPRALSSRFLLLVGGPNTLMCIVLLPGKYSKAL